MKILITGSHGQLGTELLRQLKEGRSEIGPIPEKLCTAKVIPTDADELDITDRDEVVAFVRRMEPDVIINCAAYTNVDGCESHTEDAFKVNALGPGHCRPEGGRKTGACFHRLCVQRQRKRRCASG